MNKKHFLSFYNFLVLAVFILAFFLRFNKISGLPPGLGRDEVSVAYNAYSILKTGRDEHGRFLPVYFEAIGDQKLPVIIYLTVPSVKLFGLTPLGARLPFAFLGSLTIVFLYLLIKQVILLEKNSFFKGILLLAPFLLAINPWHIAYSRAVYEICLGTFFFTLGVYCFLRGRQSKKWFIAAVSVFIIAFYTYSMTRLLSPLLFFYFCFIYRMEITKFSKRFLIFTAVWGAILFLPFIITFFNKGGIYGPMGAVILTSSITKSFIFEIRSYLVNTQLSFMGPIFFNRFIMTFYEYGRNLLAALSPEFYFANGSSVAGIGTNGQFYLLEGIPFLVGLVGFFQNAIRGQRFTRLILGWIILTFLSASLTVNPPYSTRTLFIVVPMTVIIAFGWLRIFSILKNKKWLFNIFLLIVILMYVWHFTFYLFSYYIRFPVVYAKDWEAKAKDLFDYLKEEEKNVDYIVITKPEYSMYAFFLFYHQIPPQDVWRKLERHLADPDGWKHGKKFGKYEFRSINWNIDLSSKKNFILVAQDSEYPERQLVTKEIFFPTKFTVFPYGQQIVAYPEKRVAYRIWKYQYENKKLKLIQQDKANN